MAGGSLPFGMSCYELFAIILALCSLWLDFFTVATDQTCEAGDVSIERESFSGLLLSFNLMHFHSKRHILSKHILTFRHGPIKSAY